MEEFLNSKKKWRLVNIISLSLLIISVIMLYLGNHLNLRYLKIIFSISLIVLIILLSVTLMCLYTCRLTSFEYRGHIIHFYNLPTVTRLLINDKIVDESRSHIQFSDLILKGYIEDEEILCRVNSISAKCILKVKNDILIPLPQK